jgi:DNA repair protein RadC
MYKGTVVGKRIKKENKKKEKKKKEYSVGKNHWIRNWPENERPREILLTKGPDHVSDAGLIAVLLRSGTKGKDAVTFARELIQHFGGLRGLLNAKHDDLKKIHGLGPAKIAQLMAAIEIVKRQIKEEIIGKKYVKNDRDVLDYLALSLRDRKEEFFKVVFLNKGNMILDIKELAKGTVDEASVYPREVVQVALSLGATAVIFVHNHPSGSLKPSQKDLDLTKKLAAACMAVDIMPLDHIIISPDGHISLKDKILS